MEHEKYAIASIEEIGLNGKEYLRMEEDVLYFDSEQEAQNFIDENDIEDCFIEKIED